MVGLDRVRTALFEGPWAQARTTLAVGVGVSGWATGKVPGRSTRTVTFPTPGWSTPRNFQ